MNDNEVQKYVAERTRIEDRQLGVPRVRIACIIIATEKRRTQLPRVITSACCQGFDDVVVVTDWQINDAEDFGGAWPRYFRVEPLTRTTTDALVKRDVGTLATTADILVYLCDDHTLAPGFGAALRDVLAEPWDVIVPNRETWRPNGQELERVWLNNGEQGRYCGGHCGVFKRHVITAKPWSAHAHHRNWDALISFEQQERGARFVWSPRDDIAIRDIEPEQRPWL